MQMVLQLGTNLQTFEFCIACPPKSSDNHTYMRKLLEFYSHMVVTASPALFLISRLDCGALCQPIAQVASTELSKTFRKCLWGTIQLVNVRFIQLEYINNLRIISNWYSQASHLPVQKTYTVEQHQLIFWHLICSVGFRYSPAITNLWISSKQRAFPHSCALEQL